MRYSRQKKLDFISEEFQDKIKDKRVVLIGCGGVGSVLGELLVRGGFLNLVLVDNDIIDETNLQRQNFFEEDVGKPKSKALKDILRKIDSNVRIECIVDILDSNHINEIFRDSDLLVDCTDNFETRRVINEYCEREGKDWIYSGAVKTQVICCTFYGKDKLFSKVFSSEVKDEKCCDIGVLASTTFACASLVYNQILKYFLGVKENNLIKLDLWTNKLHEVKIK